MTTKFAENPDYREYEGLLLLTHALIARGEGDSEEADNLRDQMDAPWYRLSKEEQTRLRGLSGDLYMLQDEEVLDQPLLQLDICISQLKKAREWNDWGAVLGLLRRRPVQIFAQTAALLRAQAYDGLGHPNAAIPFLDFAYKSQPSDATYRILRSLTAVNAGRFTEAVPDARQILKARMNDSVMVVAAADVLLQHSLTLTGEDQARGLREVLAVIDSVFKSKSANEIAPMSLIACAHLIRSVALWGLDQKDDALHALDSAVDADPRDPLLKSIRKDVRNESESEPRHSILLALDHRRDRLRRDLQPLFSIAA